MVPSEELLHGLVDTRQPDPSSALHSGGAFKRVVMLSPLVRSHLRLGGVCVEPCSWLDFAERVEELGASVVHALASDWPAQLACLNRVPGVPVVVSVATARTSGLNLVAGQADQFWCSSEMIAQSMQRRYGIAPERLAVCAEPVDLALFKPGPIARWWEGGVRPGLRWRLLHVVRPEHVDDAITALETLLLLPSAHLVLAGGNGNRELAEKVSSLGLRDRVALADAQTAACLPGLYNWAEIVLAAPLSPASDGTVAQALACGCAVVTSPSQALCHGLVDGRDAIVVEDPTDPTQLAAAVRRLLDDEEHRTAILRQARRAVSGRAPSEVAAVRSALYTRLCAPSTVGGATARFSGARVGVAESLTVADSPPVPPEGPVESEATTLQAQLTQLQARQLAVEIQLVGLGRALLPEIVESTPPPAAAPDPQSGGAPSLLARGLLLTERAFAGWVRWRRGLQPNEALMMSWPAFIFDKFKREQAAGVPATLQGFACPSVPGLASVVLPAYNGADLMRESIESVLAQTYGDLELIIVDDGSTDETGAIAEEYAARDQRVRVVHQENRKLPGALNTGFNLARGEFVTWTSCDNRMKPQFLTRLIDCLRRHPNWDAVYANMDLIGPDGEYLRGSAYWCAEQTPPGSEHIHLRADTSELNTVANNFVGLAFLYRDRVTRLLGGYGTGRFTVEDYDYWMRINALLTLRHADFAEPVYEFRFHGESLTSRHKELRIAEQERRLMAFEDSRRDLIAGPLTWLLDGDAARSLAEARSYLAGLGDIVSAAGEVELATAARLWQTRVYLRLSASDEDLHRPLPPLPAGTLTVLVRTAPPAADAPPAPFDFCLQLAATVAELELARQYGWFAAAELPTLLLAVDIRARSQQLTELEGEAQRRRPTTCKLTAVVCTYQRRERLERTVRSLAQQSLPADEYEVVVVNNSPEPGFATLLADWCRRWYEGDGQRLRLVDCPVPGLSHARNAGISEAKGEVVFFTDDDAEVDEHCLRALDEAFADEPDYGVIGGHIVLERPEPAPNWLSSALHALWSERLTELETLTEVTDWREYPWGANWAARRQLLLDVGGFRVAFGRKGRDYGGGEEIVTAALIARLGFKVGLTPMAVVRHVVEPSRFSLQHVRSMIRAAEFGNYRLEQRGYVPRETDFWTQVAKARWLFARWWAGDYDSRRLITWYRLQACLSLLVHLVAERRERMREPVCRTQLE